MQYILSVLVSNHFGVLNRVTNLFSRRGYNVKELTVGETLNPEYSRITVITEGDEEIMDQIYKQIVKLVDVKRAQILPNDEALDRELLLVKLGFNGKAILEIEKAGGKILDKGDCIIAEITGGSEEVGEFLNSLKKYNIIEISRTGVTALQKGAKNFLSI